MCFGYQAVYQNLLPMIGNRDDRHESEIREPMAIC